MLNTGRGTAEPGDRRNLTDRTASEMPNLIAHRQLFAPYGDGSAGVLSTPGSAPFRSPRPALSIIGQLRSPFLCIFRNFDTPSILMWVITTVFNVLFDRTDAGRRCGCVLGRDKIMVLHQRLLGKLLLCRGEMVAAFVSGYFAVLDGAAGATVYAAEAHCAIAVPAGRAVGRCERDVVHGALRHASSA